MNVDGKVPPPPRLPTGLIALARGLPLLQASTSRGTKPRAAEPEEATRAWRPDRAWLQPDPQSASASDFAIAANEETVVRAINLKDPCLFRSEPPPAPVQHADSEWPADDTATIEFVGALTGLNLDEAQPVTPAIHSGEEKASLYRPLRSHLPPEEPTDEFETAAGPTETKVLSPGPPKVIIAPAVLADSAPDPARTEATKRRRGRRGADTKLGLSLCLLGGLSLAVSAASWHPKIGAMTHEAYARVAGAVSSLLHK